MGNEICCHADCTEKGTKCSRCKWAHYCGKEHQTADWDSHKADCLRRKNVNIFEEPLPTAAQRTAQDRCYDAFDLNKRDYNGKMSMARQALAIDPGCLDAHELIVYCYLNGPPGMKDLQSALQWCDAGLALRSDVGKFILDWGHLENRPYLRLAYSKVQVLRELNDLHAASKEAIRIMRLSEGRYVTETMGIFFATQDWTALDRLFRYRKGWLSTSIAYSKVLFDYHRYTLGECSVALLNESLISALEQNQHVPLMQRPCPPFDSESYGPGTYEDAQYYLTSCGGEVSWGSVDGAWAWLVQQSMMKNKPDRRPPFSSLLRLLENKTIMVIVRPAAATASSERKLVCTRSKPNMPYPLCGGPEPKYFMGNSQLSFPADFADPSVTKPFSVFLPVQTREEREVAFVSFRYDDVVAVPFWKTIEERVLADEDDRRKDEAALAAVEAEEKAEEEQAAEETRKRIASLPPPPPSVLFDNLNGDAIAVIASFLSCNSLGRFDSALTNHNRRSLWFTILRRTRLPALDQHLHTPASLKWIASPERQSTVTVLKFCAGGGFDDDKPKKKGRIKFKHAVKGGPRFEYVRELDFNGNHDVTSDIVLALVSACPNVENISLQSLGNQCGFGGGIGDSTIAAIGQHCVKLKELDLSQLNIGDEMARNPGPFRPQKKALHAIVTGCPALETLYLGAYDVTDEDFKDIGNSCLSLRKLVLDLVPVTPVSLKHLSRCRLLDDLYMDLNTTADFEQRNSLARVTFDPASWIRGVERLAAGCSQLKRLNTTNITPDLLKAIARGCHNLEELSLTAGGDQGLPFQRPSGRVSCFVDALAAVAQGCTRLAEIDFRGPIITDRGLLNLAHGRCRLRSVDLDLYGCSSAITAKGIVVFLEALDTYGHGVLEHMGMGDFAGTDVVLATLAHKHPQLKTLRLEGCSVQPATVATFLSKCQSQLTNVGLYRCSGITLQHVRAWRLQYNKVKISATSENFEPWDS